MRKKSGFRIYQPPAKSTVTTTVLCLSSTGDILHHITQETLLLEIGIDEDDIELGIPLKRWGH